MRNNSKTVQFVVDSHLCTSCGVCAGICPSDSIQMVIDAHGIFTPLINRSTCNECGICVKVCPGYKFDYIYFTRKIHKKLPNNIALGHCIGSFSGYTSDEHIMKMSQSGGFVSALLIYCLEHKIIDGAVVTKWQKDNPFLTETYISKNAEEVLDAVGSKYNPVPAGKIVRKLLAMSGNYIFVGTPCQIQGMRKVEELFPQIKKRIKLYIGLHCLKVFNYYYQDQILCKLKIKKENVKYFRLKDKAWRGWPGDMRIISKSGVIYDLSGAYSRLWARSYFSNWRCQLCFDKLNEFSDISCGDCRIPGSYSEKSLQEVYYKAKGHSDIIIRTERGKEIFERFIDDKVFNVIKSDEKELVASVAIAEKKLGVSIFKAFSKIFNISTPSYGINFKRRDKNIGTIDKILLPYSVIASGHYYLCHMLVKYKIFRFLLKRIPHSLLGRLEMIREKRVYHVKHRRETELIIEEE